VSNEEILAYSFDSAEKATTISKHQWRVLAKKKLISVAKVGRRILIPASELQRITAAGAVMEVTHSHSRPEKTPKSSK
jgi:hypothetical protein